MLGYDICLTLIEYIYNGQILVKWYQIFSYFQPDMLKPQGINYFSSDPSATYTVFYTKYTTVCFSLLILAFLEVQ